MANTVADARAELVQAIEALLAEGREEENYYDIGVAWKAIENAIDFYENNVVDNAWEAGREKGREDAANE
jgi:hypothetical protein